MLFYSVCLCVNVGEAVIVIVSWSKVVSSEKKEDLGVRVGRELVQLLLFLFLLPLLLLAELLPCYSPLCLFLLPPKKKSIVGQVLAINCA